MEGMKSFNTTAVCIPEKHYMVDLTDRVKEIKKLIDAGKYFTINRARQYGKTTTLFALRKELREEYTVVSMDFQRISADSFRSEGAFAQAFLRNTLDLAEFGTLIIDDVIREEMLSLTNAQVEEIQLDRLFRLFMRWNKKSDKAIVLFIDEVDSATNNQIFLDFLAGLRDQYISRDTEGTPAFWSVVLAGVTDVKHLKSKIRDDQEHKVNSPWNIAADFDIDMSLPEPGIRRMLEEYKRDHHLGMDAPTLAAQIRSYTNGYPFLVSRICEIIDTKLVPESFSTLEEAWSEYGVDEAVKQILSEDNTLFDSIMGKLVNTPELKSDLRKILLRGETIAYQPDDEEQKLLRMYGFIVNRHNVVAVANRIFEMRLYSYFIGESKKNEALKQLAAGEKSVFVEEGGWLNVPKIMEHFIVEHNRIHDGQDEKFLEAEGRERFLTYLAPIINGTGTYSVEEQTRDQRRMDVVIHYLGKRYVVELKIWRGERYHAEGEKQIADYLDYFGLQTGYMLSFNFNHNKEPGVKRVQVEGKVLFEGTV